MMLKARNGAWMLPVSVKMHIAFHEALYQKLLQHNYLIIKPNTHGKKEN